MRATQSTDNEGDAVHIYNEGDAVYIYNEGDAVHIYSEGDAVPRSCSTESATSVFHRQCRELCLRRFEGEARTVPDQGRGPQTVPRACSTDSARSSLCVALRAKQPLIFVDLLPWDFSSGGCWLRTSLHKGLLAA